MTQPVVSVVTGTYNRLNSLKRMVQSVRDSLYKGITYEIVLVDGGSTDGTIDWCKQQSDVVLVEQKELLGAVKAFNAGFKKAQGKYVVVANDDVAFVDDSITCGIVFMQKNPKIGIGCFHQDRDKRNWHVEVMSIIKDGIRQSGYYGQVCIIPKFLGDKVGWWGDYTHTYGGDNEMSANVYEHGYDIQPVPCGCVHDLKVEDELREINKGDPKHYPGGNHPDTALFHNKWKAGIRFGKLPENFQRLDRIMRVLYLPIYEPGHAIQKETKHSLLDSLAKSSIVAECDYMSMSLDDIDDMAYVLEPDLFLIQVQDGHGEVNAHYLKKLRSEHPNAKIFVWNGDYHPENLLAKEYTDLLLQCDLSGFATEEIFPHYQSLGINHMFLQIGVEEHPIPEEGDEWDIVFLGNAYSRDRMKLGTFLQGLPYKIGLFGSWPQHYGAIADTTYDFYESAKIMRASKFVVSDQQWPNSRGYVSNRLFQSLYANGGVVLQQWFAGIDDLLGFKHGEHLLVWHSLDDIPTLVEAYISNKRLRRRISDAGKRHVMEQYTFDNFVNRMLRRLYGL